MVKKGTKICKKCKRVKRGIISKYHLKVCKMCFREIAPFLNFEKLI